ncbi:MAG TPA: SDR family oxidoreductase [Bryobacteraceae bacterium]|nr:SDR family oxidoreductase [Bryobacteraceae bacterium]
MAGEVVVVTGASAGLGRAIVRRFAGAGARIGLVARGVDGLEAARGEVERAGGAALALPTDVADAAQVEAAAEAVERAFGPIGIWVNDAMATVFSPFLEITPEEFKRATEVTYLGTVHGTRAALKRMVPRDRGVIVQVGSALAYRSIPLQAPYCGAKAAVRGFTDSIRTELLHQGSNVRLTMVQMPALNTPQFDWCRTRLPNHPQPVPPVFEPELGADAVFFAAHHPRRELHVGMPSVLSIIGNKFVPGLLDRYLGKTGYRSQQTSRPVQPGRPDNLFEPAPGDFGAHGSFDLRAHRHSPQWWADRHRSWLALIGAGVAAGVALYRRRLE